MPRPAVTAAGVGVVGIVGYYLYQAGGNPKVAEKQAEYDASRLSTKIKGEMPGKATEYKNEAKVLGEKVGAQVDDLITDARKKTADAEKQLNNYVHDASKKLEYAKEETRKDFNSAVNTFDATVEKKASEVSSGISSWFGRK